MAARGRGGVSFAFGGQKRGPVAAFAEEETKRKLVKLDEDDDAAAAQKAAKEEEVDPLEAFMAEIKTMSKKEDAGRKKAAEVQKKQKSLDEAHDPFEHLPAAKEDTAALGEDSDEEVYRAAKEADAGDDDEEDGKGKGQVAPLEKVDHNAIEYEEFEKCFYEECEEIAKKTEAEVHEIRRTLDIQIRGTEVPRPIQRFDQCGFDKILLAAITKQGYEKPTSIQAQAIPAILSGRDVLGIAKTGSGKTAAFILPMIMHIMDQRELVKGEGPIGVVLVPTRELAEQIYVEARKFSKGHGIRVAAVFGGASKHEQFKTLRQGAEIVIATPGRLIDIVKMKGTNFKRTTYIVLDEADRMFDMGFEYQVRSIVSSVRPDRQTMLFSATFKRNIELLCKDVLNDPARITVGQAGEANADVRQVVDVLNDHSEKWGWLVARLRTFMALGNVLVFVSTKQGAEELSKNLVQNGFPAAAIHGDLQQWERSEVVKMIKNNTLPILIATDVAARGLDIKSIKTVINFDVARDHDTHTHRVGRTGRAGATDGTAYTLIIKEEAKHAPGLIKSLESTGQPVPAALTELAGNRRYYARGGGRGGRGGRGGGRGGGPARVGVGFSGASGSSSSGPVTFQRASDHDPTSYHTGVSQPHVQAMPPSFPAAGQPPMHSVAPPSSYAPSGAPSGFPPSGIQSHGPKLGLGAAKSSFPPSFPGSGAPDFAGRGRGRGRGAPANVSYNALAMDYNAINQGAGGGRGRGGPVTPEAAKAEAAAAAALIQQRLKEKMQQQQ